MLRVIIADDESMVLESTIRYLGVVLDKVECEGVENGRDLVERVKRGGCNVVITDYEMPVMDGLTAIGEIRKFNPDIPICMHSGRKIESEAKEAGATTYLEKGKPETPGRIKEFIERYM